MCPQSLRLHRGQFVISKEDAWFLSRRTVRSSHDGQFVISKNDDSSSPQTTLPERSCPNVRAETFTPKRPPRKVHAETSTPKGTWHMPKGLRRTVHAERWTPKRPRRNVHAKMLAPRNFQKADYLSVAISIPLYLELRIGNLFYSEI